VALSTDKGLSHPDFIKAKSLKERVDTQIPQQVEAVMHTLASKVEMYKARADDAQAKLDEAKATDIKRARGNQGVWGCQAGIGAIQDAAPGAGGPQPAGACRIEAAENRRGGAGGHAQIEEKPVRPNKALNIVLGVIVGLVVGLGLAFFIEYLDTSVKTIDDVERTLQAPCWASFPKTWGTCSWKARRGPHAELTGCAHPTLFFSRKDDKLNTHGRRERRRGRGQIDDGLQSGHVFAQGGQRVLMVDSDLRRPTLHKLLQVSNNLGLTNYLLKQNTLDEM